MTTTPLTFSFNPFAFDDAHQSQETVQATAPIGDARNAVNSFSGGGSQEASGSSAGHGAVSQSELLADLDTEDGEGLSPDDPYADSSSYIGTQLSVFA